MLNLKKSPQLTFAVFAMFTMISILAPSNAIANQGTDPGVKCKCGTVDGVGICAANGDDSTCAEAAPCNTPLHNADCIPK